MEDIIIIGYGGFGYVIEDSINSLGEYRIVGYVDYAPKEKTKLELSWD